MRVAGTKNVSGALLNCTADTDTLRKAFELSSNLRISGTTALDLAYVAAGKTDAVIASGVPSNVLAAGLLLVKEAGGYIVEIGQTDVRSEDLGKVLTSGNLIATNEALRQKIAETMA